MRINLGPRDSILNTKVARRACAGRAPGKHSPLKWLMAYASLLLSAGRLLLTVPCMVHATLCRLPTACGPLHLPSSAPSAPFSCCRVHFFLSACSLSSAGDLYLQALLAALCLPQFAALLHLVRSDCCLLVDARWILLGNATETLIPALRPLVVGPAMGLLQRQDSLSSSHASILIADGEPGATATTPATFFKVAQYAPSSSPPVTQPGSQEEPTVGMLGSGWLWVRSGLGRPLCCSEHFESHIYGIAPFPPGKARCMRR